MTEPTLPEESLFARARAIASAAERAAFLDSACRDDPALRAGVEALLRADDRAGDLLDLTGGSPNGSGPATDRIDDPERTAPRAASGEAAGATVAGRYRLLEPIGEGGMGSVWMAEQREPVKRFVALKLIKPGMDSRAVLARFEAERQALALMDHPHIARILDGGTTCDEPGGVGPGRPYFVMELVRGRPLTEYCDARRLSIRDRLGLFVPICAAVQHAHQKGVIHRDLKPTNILVTEHDGKPVPKVIDFGLAKALGGAAALTDRTLYTAFGTVVGTPLYMAPEQVGINALDIDTRSDVYALGVILYELLTGTTPLEKRRLKEAAWEEVRRVIREEEPPRPSTRLSSSDALPSLAAVRQTEPVKLARLVRGDLDWIVMKALEKDRARRYETANELARDVERYLAEEPVEASPPSAIYRLRKLLRRNRSRVVAASLLALALVAAIAFGLWHNRQLDRKNRELVAANEAERRSKREAERRESETEAVLDFVEKEIFAAARPEGQEGGLGRDVTLRRAVEAALPFVDRSFLDQPLIEARLRMTLGKSFAYLGELKIAADQVQMARTIYSKHLGPDHPDTLASMHNLANCYYHLGRHADALKLREDTLALKRAQLGPDHPDTLMSMSNLALSYDAVGRRDDAMKLHEETLALKRAQLGPHHPQTLSSMNNLALCYSALGRHADALRLGREALAHMRAQLGPDHPDTLASMDSLGLICKDLGRHGEAIKLYEGALALMRAQLGPDHPRTLASLNGLAGLLATCPDARLRDPKRAVELARDAVERAPRSGASWQVLGWARYRTGAWKDSIAALEKSIELRTDGGDPSQWFFLAMAHWQAGHKDQARQWYDRAVEWVDRSQPADAQWRLFRAEAAELLERKEKESGG